MELDHKLFYTLSPIFGGAKLDRFMKVFMAMYTSVDLLQYLSSYLEQCGDEYDALMAFKPTGWTYSGGLSSVRPQTNGAISIYG